MKKRSTGTAILAIAVVFTLALTGCSDSGSGGSSVSSNANLRDLSVDSGALAPAFSPNVTAYTVDVANSVTSINVSAAAADSKAHVLIDPLSPVSLNEGPNTITITVTAENGVQKNYTVTVTRAIPDSTNANLASLSINGVPVPGFAPENETYTIIVPYATAQVTAIAAIAQETGAAVALPSLPAALSPGNNSISITVTAPNLSTTKTYTVTVTRTAASTNNNLDSLSISTGVLAPAFSSATAAYTVDVGNAISAITISASAADSLASVSQSPGTLGTAVSLSAVLPLENTITVTVTAENGVPKPYTITVRRAAPDLTNAKLASLSIAGIDFTPAFSPTIFFYSATVPYTKAAIAATDIVPTKQETGAGFVISPGTPSIALSAGSSTSISITVTAEDTTTTETYVINIYRTAANSNTNLGSLSVSPGALSPAFASGTSSYTVNVGNAVSSITVSAAPQNSLASVSQSPGTLGTAIPLAVGSTTITVTVTAEDGSANSYTIYVNRAAAVSTNAQLASLSINGAPVPSFTPAFGGPYTVNVPRSKAQITAADVAALQEESGAAIAYSPALPLNLGIGATTTLTITVTAPDTTTTKAYTVNIIRPASDNNKLSSLYVSGAALSPGFDPDILSYTVNVASSITAVTISAAKDDSNATGPTQSPGTLGSSSSIDEGSNYFTITVTAENGATRAYFITVNRQVSTALSGITINGQPVPGFAPATLAYTVTTPSSTSQANVTGIPASLSASAAYSPAKIINLTPGVQAAVSITVSSGISSTVYTVNITRQLQAVTFISLSPSTASLVIDAELQLSAAILPESATNKALNWSSSSATVASVDENGLVRAIAPGTTTISAAAADGSGIIGASVITVQPADSDTAGISIIFEGFSDETINLTQSTTNDISKSRNQSLAAILSGFAAYDSVEWRVDGNYVYGSYVSGNYTVSVNPSSMYLSLGTHSLLALVYKEGVPYAKEIVFKVIQ